MRQLLMAFGSEKPFERAWGGNQDLTQDQRLSSGLSLKQGGLVRHLRGTGWMTFGAEILSEGPR